MSDNDMFEKVQRLYIEKYQSKSTIPIPRKKFLEAGWDEEMFLRYYTECSELYFSQLTCPHTGWSSNSKEIAEINGTLSKTKSVTYFKCGFISFVGLSMNIPG